MNKTSLQTGINLGGWISQYQKYDSAHFDSFILESDIQQIANWGFDHVRLPVDYPVLEDDERHGEYKESGFAYLDNCLQWCQKAGLRLVLDLHRAPGYSFTNTLEASQEQQNSLFNDPGMQERFISVWETITRRYLDQAEDALAFELLNEMVLPDSAPWNTLARQTINHIRSLDPSRLIVIGGNYYNAVTELKNIAVQDDPNLLHTFHFYEPMVVTHQKASWVLPMQEFNQGVEYPGIPQGLGDFLVAHPTYKPQLQSFVDFHIDQTYLREGLQPAVDFIKQKKQPLYCGEFGVIDQASMSTRINWNRDFIALLREFGIGYAYWTYKAMDFGLVDQLGQVVDDKLIKVIAGQ